MEIKVKEKMKKKNPKQDNTQIFFKKKKEKEKENEKSEQLRDGKLRYLDHNDIWRMIYIKCIFEYIIKE